jgi:hypothetical protein
MKKIILALAVLGMAAAGASTANAGVRFSIGIPAPVVTYGYAAPVYAPAPPVVYAPAPPVVYAPPPVVVYPAPRFVRPVPRIYRAPEPVVRFRLGFGPFGPFYRHGHW